MPGGAPICPNVITLTPIPGMPGVAPIFLEQFALELLIGAHENSEWLDGKLVIDANHGPIHLLQAAFYAVKLEAQRRAC